MVLKAAAAQGMVAEAPEAETGSGLLGDPARWVVQVWAEALERDTVELLVGQVGMAEAYMATAEVVGMVLAKVVVSREMVVVMEGVVVGAVGQAVSLVAAFGGVEERAAAAMGAEKRWVGALAGFQEAAGWASANWAVGSRALAEVGMVEEDTMDLVEAAGVETREGVGLEEDFEEVKRAEVFLVAATVEGRAVVGIVEAEEMGAGPQAAMLEAVSVARVGMAAAFSEAVDTEVAKTVTEEVAAQARGKEEVALANGSAVVATARGVRVLVVVGVVVRAMLELAVEEERMVVARTVVVG